MKTEIMRWLLFPRYMLAYKLFLMGLRFTTWAMDLSPSLGREMSRYVRLKDLGMGDQFEVQPGTGLEVGNGK